RSGASTLPARNVRSPLSSPGAQARRTCTWCSVATAVSMRSMRASATRVAAIAGTPVAPRTASARSTVSIGRSMDESIPTTDGRAMKQVPRILLVEDDPVTQAYLAAVLEALPATVDAVASAGEAMRAVSGGGRGTHALWLVDAHLPDADGAGLLARLRPV